MTITLNFGYSPNKDGVCKSPPSFYSVNMDNVCDGHLEYAKAVAESCAEAAKKAVAKIAKKRGAA